MWPFSLLPEQISGSLYAGPGSGALQASAKAWDNLGAELQTAATSYGSVISELTGNWQGPASTAMSTAVSPYIAWVSTTATQVEMAANQARAAATAFETAHGMAVNPAVITANRAQLASLMATNVLGQNFPAIAATEAQYLEMWAQDILTMLTYAGSAQTATTSLVAAEPTPPPATAQPEAQLMKTASLTQNVAAPASSILNGLSLPSIPGLGDLTGLFGSVNTGINGAFAPLNGIPLIGPTLANPTALVTNYGSTFSRFGTMPFTMLLQQLLRGGATGATASTVGKGASGSTSLIGGINQLIDARLTPMLGTLTNHITTWGQAVSAQVGQAHSLGSLSVPQGWAHEGAAVRAAPILPNSSMAATPMASAGMGGSPFTHAMTGAMAGRGMGGLASKIRPKITPKADK